MYFFKDTNGNWIIGESVDSIVSKVPCELRKSSPTTVAVRTVESRILLLSPIEVTALRKNAAGDFYATYAEFKAAVSDFFDNAPITSEEVDAKIGAEVDILSDRIDTVEGIANAASSGSLGSIKPTDAAPTPERNGNYTFSIGGAKPAWLTAEAGVTTVKAGDGVAVVYTEPSSYSYTHVDIDLTGPTSPIFKMVDRAMKMYNPSWNPISCVSPNDSPSSNNTNDLYYPESPGVYVNFNSVSIPSDYKNYVIIKGLVEYSSVYIDANLLSEKNRTDNNNLRIKITETNENVFTIDYLKFRGEMITVSEGEIVRTTTQDTDILNSDFILLDDLNYIEVNGNSLTGVLAIAFFKSNYDKSFISAEYGDVVTYIDWKSLKSSISVIAPVDAKYAILQINKTPLLNVVGYKCNIVSKIGNIVDKLSIDVRDTIESLKITETNENVFTIDYLKFRGEMITVSEGEIVRTTTQDTDILNSDFILLDDLNYIEVNGNSLTGVLAIAFFKSNYDKSFISAEYGDVVTYIDWKSLKSSISVIAPVDAKYAILQINKTPLLNVVGYKCNIVSKKPKILNSYLNCYNVKDYGAKGDGVNDDTSSIQLALDDCYKKGGGIVYIPNGIYRLATIYNRGGQINHLFIPLSTSIYESKQIRIIGESVNTYKMYLEFSGSDANRPLLSGSVLLSDYSTEDPYVTTPISIIGSEKNDGYITGANETRFEIENVNIVSKLGVDGYPIVSGINAIRLAHVHVNNVNITSDSAAIELQLPPSNHVSFGFAGCNNLCDPPQGLKNVNISGGFQYGVIVGEHMLGHGVDIQTCIRAFVFCFAYHPSLFTLCSAHNCSIQVSAIDKVIDNLLMGHSIIKFDLLDIECNKGVSPEGFNYSMGVEDPNNVLIGKIEYLMVNGAGSVSGLNSGINNMYWNKNGASGVTISTLNP